MIGFMVQHHADCPITNLRGKLVRRLAHRRPFLSGVRASGNPRAVQVARLLSDHIDELERKDALLGDVFAGVEGGHRG